MNFLGILFSYTTFSKNNKRSLLTYIEANLKNVLAAKEAPNKNLLLIPYYLLAITIVTKSLVIEENFDQFYDTSIIEILINIARSSFSN